MVLLLLTGIGFAQMSRRGLRSSSGRLYELLEWYEGKYKGQSYLDSIQWKWDELKPTREEIEIVRMVLNGYVTTRGDTFVIWITKIDNSVVGHFFICEITSATQFDYWALNRY
jgi:hypothetical protein